MLDFHDEIPDIRGKHCTAVVVQERGRRAAGSADASILFLRLEDGVWHRIQLDEQTLSWRQVDRPDFAHSPRDAVRADDAPRREALDTLIDVGALHGLTGKPVTDVRALDLPEGAELHVSFAGAPTLVLRGHGGATEVEVRHEGVLAR